MEEDQKVQMVRICREKLVEVAKARKTIYYSELARHLGVENQDPMLGQCLDTIYEEEVRCQGCPDLTLVVISMETGLGRFNSRGERTRTVRVNTGNRDAVAIYIEDLKKVHEYYATQLA